MLNVYVAALSSVYTIGMRSQKHEGRHGPGKHESCFMCHEALDDQLDNHLHYQLDKQLDDQSDNQFSNQ